MPLYKHFSKRGHPPFHPPFDSVKATILELVMRLTRMIGNLCIHSYCTVLMFRSSDFRKAFSSIGGLMALTDAPFMALSASAPPLIAKAIVHLQSPVLIEHQQNIFFLILNLKAWTCRVPQEVIHGNIKDNSFLSNKQQLYCHLMKAAHSKQAVNMYHASLTKATKAQIHQEFSLVVSFGAYQQQ